MRVTRLVEFSGGLKSISLFFSFSLIFSLIFNVIFTQKNINRKFQNTKKISFFRISGDVMEAVLCTALRKNSSMATWNRLWKFHKETNIVAEKETVLSTIGCATNEDLHKKYVFLVKAFRDQDMLWNFQTSEIMGENGFVSKSSSHFWP